MKGGEEKVKKQRTAAAVENWTRASGMKARCNDQYTIKACLHEEWNYYSKKSIHFYCCNKKLWPLQRAWRNDIRMGHRGLPYTLVPYCSLLCWTYSNWFMGCWGSDTNTVHWNSNQTSKDCTKAKKVLRAYCHNILWIDPTKKKKKEKKWMIDPVLLFISFCSNQLSPIFCGAEPTSITWNNGIALSSTYLYIKRFFKLSHKWVEITFELVLYLYEIFISLQFLYFDTIDYYTHFWHVTIHLLWSSKHSLS